MLRGLLVAMLAAACAQSGTAPTPEPRWRVPDGACGDLIERASPLELGLSPTLAHLVELLASDSNDYQLGYHSGSSPGEAREADARARKRRVEIDRLIAEDADALLELALTSDQIENADDRVARAKVDGVAALLERAIACGREGPDPMLLSTLARVPDEGGFPALHRIAHWPAWEVQTLALFALDLGGDPEAAWLRKEIAATHWSRQLQSPRLQFGGPNDHGAAGCEQGLPEQISIVRGDEVLEIPRFEHRDPPRHELPPAYVRIERRGMDLRDEADVMLAVDDGWLVGVNHGEFGGGLFVVSASGEVRQLDAAPLLEIRNTDLGIVALTGLAHLGLTQGRIVGITRDATGRLQRRHRFALPAPPEGMVALPGGTLVVATAMGIVELAPDDTVTLWPCAR